MTIQIDPEKFLAMLASEGIAPSVDTQLHINNTNAVLARMPNFTADDLQDLLMIMKDMVNAKG